MKSYCKSVNPADIDTILPFVWGCFDGKWSRNDYSSFLSQYSSLSKKEIKEIARTGSRTELEPAIQALAKDITNRIKSRNLRLDPVYYQKRVDGMSNKIREIGIESPFQQVCEHVAVGCMQDLFHAKYEYYQCASRNGKGQMFGAKSIQKWIQEDLYSEDYARRNCLKYHRKCLYHVKADIHHCYPSMRREVVMSMLQRDIHKNPLLLWLIDELLSTHEHGFIIGSLLSQYLCNYMLSYAYREVSGYTKERRGRQIRLVNHVLFYMDDMLLIGSDRRNLKMAVKKMEKYMRDSLGLKIKQTWHIKQWDREPIDMMGYKIYGDGHMEIRARIFLRARRTYVSAAESMTIDKARKVCAYKGYFKYTDSTAISEKLHVPAVSALAGRYISNYDKEGKVT